MKTNAIVERVYNKHITDEYGATISDEFLVKYKSGQKRKFKCRNSLSNNVADFIRNHADNSKVDSITDKNKKTFTAIIWR